MIHGAEHKLFFHTLLLASDITWCIMNVMFLFQALGTGNRWRGWGVGSVEEVLEALEAQTDRVSVRDSGMCRNSCSEEVQRM